MKVQVTKIAEKYLTNVNGLCIFLHDCFLPSQYKKTQKAFYWLYLSLILLFSSISIKWVEVKKKKCRFCRLACYVRRNRQCFLISYADRSFLKLFRAGSCILVSYSCRDLFKSVDFLTRKWMKYSLDVYLVNSSLILFLSQYVINTGIVLKGI